MTVLTSAHGTIVLKDSCPSEDAEVLVRHLASNPTADVDLRNCDFAHTAVIQVLLAFKPVLLGPPLENSIWRWVYPALDTHK
jgi:hypothetical protein